jgi:hypothetical protein
MKNITSNYTTNFIVITALCEGSFKFFGDIQRTSCDLVGEGLYACCSDKDPEEIKPKDQGCHEATEKIVKISPDDGNTGLYLKTFHLKSYSILNKYVDDQYNNFNNNITNYYFDDICY